MSPDTRNIISDAIAMAWRTDIDRFRFLASDEETLVAMFVIRAQLQSLFRDQEVEREWLRQPNEGLGTSPLDLILSGKEGALKVQQFVERLSGL